MCSVCMSLYLYLYLSNLVRRSSKVSAEFTVCDLQPPTPWCFMILSLTSLRPGFLICSKAMWLILCTVSHWGPGADLWGRQGCNHPSRFPEKDPGAQQVRGTSSRLPRWRVCSASTAHGLSQSAASWGPIQWNESRPIQQYPLAEGNGLLKVHCNLHQIHLLVAGVESFNSVYSSFCFSY